MTARTWKPGEPGSGRFVAASGIGLDLAEFLVGAATWAPSLHNTQPWRFVHRADGSIELWADQRRALRATDPAGREMVISCGAALATLALGVRWLGHQPEVRRCPDPGRPMLLARIAAGPARAPSPLELDQFAAVLDRHTHRGPFDNVPVAPALLVCLRRLARRVGCRAQLIDDSRLRRVVELTLAAQQTQCGQPSVRAEQNDWLRLRVSPEQDGVILAVPGGISTGVARLAPRWLGAPATPPAISPETGANHPPTILLSTSDDDTVAWLRTGEALQHILLYAATHGVYASIHTQPVEVPSTRAELARISSDAHPQMLFQLGHATSVSESHRRAVAQVLVARR